MKKFDSNNHREKITKKYCHIINNIFLIILSLINLSVISALYLTFCHVGSPWDVFHYSQHTCVRTIHLFPQLFLSPMISNYREGSTLLLNRIPSISPLFQYSNTTFLLESSVLLILFGFVCPCH